MRIAIPILLAFATCLHGAEPTTLLPTNSTEGLTTGWGSKGGVQILALAKGPGDTTDGDGALHLSMTSIAGRGNKYLSMKVSLPAPVDLRSSRVLIDARTNHPETTKSFYVRFYNEGESEPAWSFNSWSGQLKKDWRTFSVQRHLCMDGLAWEAGVVGDRIADRVTRIEFIMGTSEDNVQVDMLIDNIRVAKRIGSLSELKIYKTILHDTVLVADGKAASIVLHPDSEAGRAAAATVIEAIRKATGATLTARPATESDRVFDETAILLGNLNTNPAMLLLYGRRLTPVDSVCPGKGGALVHTVFDPFGKGANAIILGASDDAGLARAASVFTDRVAKQGAPGELAFPRLFDRHYGKDFIAACSWADDEPSPKRLEQGLKAGQRRLDRGTHTSIAGELASVAKRYALTGHSVEAKLYVQLWDMYAKSAVADPRKFGGPWGFDSDFPSRIVVPGWDLIEEDPTLTDEERVSTLQHLGRWMAETVVPSCAGAATSTHLPHNHQTFPALGTMFAGIHMSQSFPKLMEGPFWLSIADRIFQRQATYFKPYEDCNGYQWLTNGHLFGYALARPDFTVFTNGNGKRIIDFCIGNMDNLGYQVPYGDTGSWVCWNSEMICLDRYAFATGDPVARWAANHKRDIKRTRLSAADYMQLEPGAKPTRFDGVRIWPLEPAFYETFPVDNRPPLNLCFDKVTFREALDSQAAYLLLDGLSNGGHKHYDGNSISRLTQFDRIWLADNDYYKQPVKFHNSMLVFRDGASEQIPAYTQLLGSGESDAYGYSRSRVNGYAGADWDRTIIWLKALKAFVILDKLTAIESGDYQFRLLWHGVGAAELTD
ncbi:MAG: hypothetical protein KAI66_11010, partial [Lentisphaeria bacterium]|nr:hypothetical protein [Lentisphaeria bacterium]